jgi:Arc/MetJ-type ribon-helix-helix transcriptional regulator
MQRNEKQDGTTFVGFRVPNEIHAKAVSKAEGKYSTLSEYLRDLVRRDLEKALTEEAA